MKGKTRFIDTILDKLLACIAEEVQVLQGGIGGEIRQQGTLTFQYFLKTIQFLVQTNRSLLQNLLDFLAKLRQRDFIGAVVGRIGEIKRGGSRDGRSLETVLDRLQ